MNSRRKKQKRDAQALSEVEGPRPAGPIKLIAVAAWRGVAELYDSEGLTHAASIASPAKRPVALREKEL